MLSSSLISPISTGNIADIIRDALENGGGLKGPGNIGDVISDLLNNGGGLQGPGKVGDLLGDLLGGGGPVHAFHAAFPNGRQAV
jgi:hypothetical protein